jgi:hypothetical protein
MAMATDIWPSLRTFGSNIDQNFVYNTEMRIYRHTSVKLVFITQATAGCFIWRKLLKVVYNSWLIIKWLRKNDQVDLLLFLIPATMMVDMGSNNIS